MIKIYEALKPLMIFLSSLLIIFKFNQISIFIKELFNLPSELTSLSISISIFVLIFGVIFSLIEYCFSKKIGKLEITVLNEDKLEGSTDLILIDDDYKTFYIKIQVIKHNKNFNNDTSKLTLIFPKGMTVSLQNNYKILGKIENEVNINVKDYNFTSNDDLVYLPIIVSKGSNNLHTNTSIVCKNNKRFWNVFTKIKFKDKKILLREGQYENY